MFKLSADVRQGTTLAGSAAASVLVGGADLEMTDPRMNAAFFSASGLGLGRSRARPRTR